MTTRPKWYCRDCKCQWSDRYGTDHEDSKLTDEQLAKAVAYFRSGRTNKSELARELGCAYKTALRLYERCRWAIVGADGLTKNQRAVKRKRAAGLCTICGKPSGGYCYCDGCRESRVAIQSLCNHRVGRNTGIKGPGVTVGLRQRKNLNLGVRSIEDRAEYRRRYYRAHKADYSRRKNANTTGRVQSTCPGCGCEWERSVYHMGTRCPPCQAAYMREYKAKRKAGWTADRRDCELCGEPMSPLSKRTSHPACAWLKMRSDSWAESERKRLWQQEQIENPTTAEGWLLRANRELARARAAVREVQKSGPTSAPAATSPAS